MQGRIVQVVSMQGWTSDWDCCLRTNRILVQEHLMKLLGKVFKWSTSSAFCRERRIPEHRRSGGSERMGMVWNQFIHWCQQGCSDGSDLMALGQALPASPNPFSSFYCHWCCPKVKQRPTWKTSCGKEGQWRQKSPGQGEIKCGWVIRKGSKGGAVGSGGQTREFLEYFPGSGGIPSPVRLPVHPHPLNWCRWWKSHFQPCNIFVDFRSRPTFSG